MRRNIWRASGALALILLLLLTFWLGRHTARRPSSPASGNSFPAAAALDAASQGVQPTTVYAHNLLLRKGPHFRIYIRWLRGRMVRTRRGVNPSFDDPQSFLLLIDKGVILARLQDLSDFLNAAASPLKNISIQTSGNQVTLHGTLHKMIALPVNLIGELSPLPDGRIRFHVAKYTVLKIPMKGLLGAFHLNLSDLASSGVSGVQISGNDILFDTLKLLPPPHIHGQITMVRVAPQELAVIYGNSPDDENSLAQWHNFIRFSGGTLDFGKITMHDVDLTMIDASKDPWFDLDLINYQAQLVNGYTRMTAKAGMEIYMPDLDEMAAKKTANQGMTLDWLKDRGSSLPSDVPDAVRAPDRRPAAHP